MIKVIRFALSGNRKKSSPDGLPLQQQWFRRGNTYWEECSPTDDGMLGGYGNLHQIDVNQSQNFLVCLIQKHGLRTQSALDCGAGIGRITKNVLSRIYNKVDLIDQSQKLIDAAKVNLDGICQARKFIVEGLQNFEFTSSYDCVWMQWALCNLPQLQAKEFLIKARENIRNTNGIIIVKENELDEEGLKVDTRDYTVVRSHTAHVKLFEECGLRILKEEVQTEWPEDLYGVRMYCLKAV